MSRNLSSLLAKRDALEKRISEAQDLEKRKKRVHQILLGALEKHPTAARADDQVLRDVLNKAFSELAQNVTPEKAS